MWCPASAGGIYGPLFHPFWRWLLLWWSRSLPLALQGRRAARPETMFLSKRNGGPFFLPSFPARRGRKRGGTNRLPFPLSDRRCRRLSSSGATYCSCPPCPVGRWRQFRSRCLHEMGLLSFSLADPTYFSPTFSHLSLIACCHESLFVRVKF